MTIELTDKEFATIQDFIFREAGISLSASKRALVCGRLEKRLRQYDLDSYSAYITLLQRPGGGEEMQIAIDLLTTNETYFFREPKHFDLLRYWTQTACQTGHAMKVWSAACSTGEEAYSIAMVLADCSSQLPWEVLGSDISTRVLQRARLGHYPVERTTHIPPHYLKRFCLRGTGEEAGTLLVQRSLRERLRFMQVNLDQPLPDLGTFDVVFARNVMIYFNNETKRRVAQRLLAHLAPGGHLLIGHSETLGDLCPSLRHVAPSVYQKI